MRLPADALISYREDRFSPKNGRAVLRLDDVPESAWRTAAAPFLERSIKYHSQPLALVCGGDQTDAERDLVSAITEHYVRARISQTTAGQSSVQWGRHFLQTLRRSPPWATSLREPLRGGPAFIVSAGPSLDLNGHLLREAQRRGPIISVNTAATACLHHGVVPDLVVCCESASLADHIEPLKGMGVPVALDATASPDNWDAADSAWAFAWQEPSIIPYVLQLGAVPINWTGSVACAATSLAILWGAAPIVLIGQDLAYTGGRYYAQGTPYADLRSEVRDDKIYVTGRSKEQEPLSVTWRPGWRGSDAVPTDHGMATFIEWFARCADRHYVVNATEGGVQIDNTYELSLEAVLKQLPLRERKPLPLPEPCDASHVRADLLREAEAFDASQHVTPPASFPLLHMWAVPAILERRDETLLQRATRIRQAMADGAREIAEAMR